MDFREAVRLASPLSLPAANVLILAALIVFFLLIVLIESVVLQLFKWGDSKSSWWASFRMNLASAVVVFACLALIPRLGFWGLILSWIFSFLAEGFILARWRREQKQYAWSAAFLANLASYLVLLLPSYWFSR